MKINEPRQINLTQTSILAQNTGKAEGKLTPALQLRKFYLRKFKLRWILAISCLPLFGIYTAFGIAPQNLNDVPTSMVIEEIALPLENNTSYPDESLSQTFWYKDHVRRDDTLNSILTRLNIRNRSAFEFIRSDNTASEIAGGLIPGRQIKAETDLDGNLIQLEFVLNNNQLINLVKTEDGYESSKDSRTLTSEPILKSAKINSSLFAATDSANIPDHIAIQLADIFESEINFHTDLRKGDRFNVVYEGLYDQGELVKAGDVLAAEFVNNGKTYRAIGLRDGNNQMQYYTPEGKSVHKSFLRSPLEFSRVSSGFSTARYHPVLQKVRAHKGVDFAAPTGTRIKASADGIVDFVGQKGGYGNVIILKHANGISTLYGHLSRFSSGLRRGARISQGAIIGFVGMTGVATGPHLHYEFLVNGQHRDPMKVALPRTNAINASNKAAFEQASAERTVQLSLLSSTNIASLE
ncbi:MAG: peptidase M23 [Betaproteobacteria bacterium HGW-Betaproteobacteria-22]|nr:MAG: peptidase M23 [Betaproteobacteria bacterium HGW-Betaproteobacteria-22]